MSIALCLFLFQYTTDAALCPMAVKMICNQQQALNIKLGGHKR